MKNKKSLLVVKSLTKKYHDLKSENIAIQDVNFEIYDKEFISIIGPSGCGKSTILSILAGMDQDYSGSITISENLKVGYMLQTDSLFPWLTILENCCIGLKIKKQLTEENKKYALSLLEKYGLIDYIDKYPSSLSGGMRQRVALIRTLALKPDILLLDEPLSALDSQSRMAIGKDIFEIIKNEKKTAIMVTHDISEALSISDRIILLTNSPGTVKTIYEIDFGNCDYYSRRLNPNFAIYQDKIWRDLDVNL